MNIVKLDSGEKANTEIRVILVENFGTSGAEEIEMKSFESLPECIDFFSRHNSININHLINEGIAKVSMTLVNNGISNEPKFTGFMAIYIDKAIVDTLS